MKKEKILIVDDDQTLAATLNEFLTQEGYVAIRAATCAETLKLADENKPDVVLLDLNLPDGSGVQILPDLVHGVVMIFPPEITADWPGVLW